MALDDGFGSPEKRPIADIVLGHVKEISSLSWAMNEKLGTKLERVSYPCPEELESDEVVVEYPEYFNELRSSLHSIKEALKKMNQTLDRTEI